MRVKKCAWCGKEFEVRANCQIYCCRRCRKKKEYAERKKEGSGWYRLHNGVNTEKLDKIFNLQNKRRFLDEVERIEAYQIDPGNGNREKEYIKGEIIRSYRDYLLVDNGKYLQTIHKNSLIDGTLKIVRSV